MIRSSLGLRLISAKALNIPKMGRGHFINGSDGMLEPWNPAENEAQNAMCLDWLRENEVNLFFMDQALETEWKSDGKCMMKEYPCRTPAERRMAVLQAVADVEEAC